MSFLPIAALAALLAASARHGAESKCLVRVALGLTVMLSGGAKCLAELTLQEGQSYTWEFQSMSPRTGSSPWLIQFGSERLSLGEVAKISYFENALTELPILEQMIPGALNGFIFFGPEADGHFQDFQGVVKVEALTGSFSIQSLVVGTRVGGKDYIAAVSPSALPEPGSGIFGFALMLLVIQRRDRRASTESRGRV